MKRLCCLCILFMLFFSQGCAKNIRNIPTDISPTESIIVGRIETIPILWNYSLYEENSKTDDQIDVKGKGFGLSKASKLQNQGYLFKIARPGIYILRLQKKIGDKIVHDQIFRFEVPEGKLVYFGTIRIVIDRIARPLQRDGMSKRTPIAFKYHYVHINEDDTLKYFADQYPLAYSAYKGKFIRISPPSQPKYLILHPSDNHFHNKISSVALKTTKSEPFARQSGNILPLFDQ